MGQRFTNFVFIALLGLVLAYTGFAMAQVASPSPAASIAPLASSIVPPTGDDFSSLLKGIGGVKGAGTLAVIALIVQALMFFFRTQLASFAGVWQLIIVNGLTLVGGVVSLMLVDHQIFLQAILNSQVLGMAQIWGHQVYNQIQKKPEDEKAIAEVAPAEAPKA